MIEIVSPTIFSQYPVKAGITLRSSCIKFPPAGYSFRKTECITDEQFKIHQHAMQQTLALYPGSTISTCTLVHGDSIVTANPEDNVREADGLISNEKGVTLCVSVADCCGIVMYSPDTQSIAAVHSGWKGTVNNIVTKAILAMKAQYGANPECMSAWLSPCAGKELYEVNKEVADYFSDIGKQCIGDNKYLLDLRAYILDSMLQQGLRKERIEVSGDCTISDMRFHSYRRDGNLGRNAVFIGQQ